MALTFEDTRSLWELADGYERWGLTPEAEEARAAYCELVVRCLAAGASADAAARPDLRPDPVPGASAPSSPHPAS